MEDRQSQPLVIDLHDVAAQFLVIATAHFLHASSIRWKAPKLDSGQHSPGKSASLSRRAGFLHCRRAVRIHAGELHPPRALRGEDCRRQVPLPSIGLDQEFVSESLGCGRHAPIRPPRMAEWLSQFGLDSLIGRSEESHSASGSRGGFRGSKGLLWLPEAVRLWTNAALR
jgi:hypothetical protein